MNSPTKNTSTNTSLPTPTKYFSLPLICQVPLTPAGFQSAGGGNAKKGKVGGNRGEEALRQAELQAREGREGGEEEEEEGLLDRPLWAYVSDRITRLLREGLGDRCVLARPLCGAAGEDGEDFRGKGEEAFFFNRRYDL